MPAFMGRRKCVALLGGALAWPLALPAQSAERMRRIGVLIYGGEGSRGAQAQAAALREGLKELGWVEGRNLQTDIRYESDPRRIHDLAQALVGQDPDAIVVSTNAATRALQQQTKTIPIVFAGVGDPVASGLVASLARPDGNITGITNLFYSIGGKWLELLWEAAPGVERVAIVYNPDLATTQGWFAAIEAAAPGLGIATIKLPIRNPAEIERAIDRFAATPNGAVIVVPPGLVGVDREMVFRLAADHRLPAIYQARIYAVEGGLMSYGADAADLFLQSATYVDRILRGARPGELPVGFPDKFDLVINLATAKALGLTLPPTLLGRANELIE
jgi:putative ABC transport system substrate-binding protein